MKTTGKFKRATVADTKSKSVTRRVLRPASDCDEEVSIEQHCIEHGPTDDQWDLQDSSGRLLAIQEERTIVGKMTVGGLCKGETYSFRGERFLCVTDEFVYVKYGDLVLFDDEFKTFMNFDFTIPGTYTPPKDDPICDSQVIVSTQVDFEEGLSWEILDASDNLIGYQRVKESEELEDGLHHRTVGGLCPGEEYHITVVDEAQPYDCVATDLLVTVTDGLLGTVLGVTDTRDWSAEQDSDTFEFVVPMPSEAPSVSSTKSTKGQKRM